MRKFPVFLSALCLTASLIVPASAAAPVAYTFDSTGHPEYGKPTSIEVIHTVDGGAGKNEDVSKNAALFPPSFGSISADTLNTGTPLTPNLIPGCLPAAGVVINGGAGTIQPPAIGTVTTSVPAIGYTEVTSDLYYPGRHLGILKIPSLNVDVKVYEGTDSRTLAKGAGHFTDTSIWDGNCAIAGHNRGTTCYFGSIHTLKQGDRMTLTTKLGTRIYEVVSVSKVRETDRSGLAASSVNTLTLYTCVRNQSAYRWQVTAAEVR